MKDIQNYSIFTLRLRQERHVVYARQRAREIAKLLGFDHQEQIRLATTASELARNAFRYATNGAVEFLVQDSSPQLFLISVTDEGPGIANLAEILNGQYVSKTGLGKGIIGTSRLMDHFNITAPPGGTRVEAGKWLPASAPRIDANRAKAISTQLASTDTADPFDEIERQNQELLKTLATLREKQEQLAELNRELEDTNRGVVALYAELDQHADDLRRVSDLKTSFLSNLSHEFRTPLNSIISLSRLLLNRSDGDLSLEQEKQVIYIQRSASELSELVNDLLDLAKVEAGKTEVRAKYFEVQDVFGALRGVLKPLLVGNSLELIFDAQVNLPPLYTDEGKVSQILRNLISNALKFTRRGHVRVTANLDAEDNDVVFSVSDTGIGIAPENLERIFEEFVQVESELQSQVKGTGLGLPLSRRLAELLGGTLKVDSEPGVGSTFVLTVPVIYGKTQQGTTQEAQIAEASGPAILLIEDNREANFVYESTLKNTKYELTFVASLHEARTAMKRLKPALVLMDRLLDGEDSLFYIEELRSTGFLGPVLVVSVVDDVKAALDAGAAAFLAKPVVPFTLLSTVQELIEGQSAKTLLLVDDDEVTRYLLGEALSRLGYRVLEARNGREAIKTVKERVVDGVFLDIIMPGLDGFEVLKEIRANENSKFIPIIIHSSKNLSVQELNLIAGMSVTIYPKQALATDASTAALRNALKMGGIEE
ncbi:response regulator [Alloacidobacterium dinghuense]|uniref:histidine kinase n=1 Tax=Alloacidobacterium dinghuense TaxID=2763107 RepID=A0A7G8BKW7_9BACT|nr:ATP-binding protein [Alloacidobacterium dinghuense]QNI33187.1 response regulator [Alloacidobacterium dinghuense]